MWVLIGWLLVSALISSGVFLKYKLFTMCSTCIPIAPVSFWTYITMSSNGCKFINKIWKHSVRKCTLKAVLLLTLDRNTELASAAYIMIACWAKKIYNLINRINKWFFFLFLACLLKCQFLLQILRLLFQISRTFQDKSWNSRATQSCTNHVN